jgi:hypothetical protein
MSEGEGVILGFDIRRGGRMNHSRMSEGGRGVFSISSVGGMDLFWNDPFIIQKLYSRLESLEICAPEISKI